MKKFIILLLIPIVFSCSPKYTKDEISIINKIDNTEVNIKFPIEKEAEIWGKVQYFIATYITTRISTVTPEMLITKYGESTGFTWSINKIKYENDFQLMINVKWNNPLGGGQEMEDFQKKALIHYLKTDEVVPQLMNCYSCKPKYYLKNPNSI